MFFSLSRRNDVRPFVVAGRPDDEQHVSRVPANALEAQLTVRFTCIFAGQQVTFKEVRQRRHVNAVLGEVHLALGFVEGDHDQNVDAIYQERRRGKWSGDPARSTPAAT